MSIDSRPIFNLTDPKGYVNTILKSIQKKYILNYQDFVKFLRARPFDYVQFESYIKSHKLAPVVTQGYTVEDRVKNRIEELAKVFGSFKPRTVLDIGYGDATITEAVASYFKLPKTDIYGIDVREIQSDYLTVLRYAPDGITIPLPDKSIDLIMMNMSLHHIEQRERILDQVYRILKDDGIVILREHDLPEREDERRGVRVTLDLVHWAYAIVNETPRDEYSNYFTRRELEELFNRHKMKKLRDVDLNIIHGKTISNPQGIYYTVFGKESIEDPWLANLRDFIRKTISPIFEKPESLERFLTPEAMTVWAESFTHELYDPEFNYEELEYVGDNVLKLVFPEYLMATFNSLTKKEYTELNRFYMSKEKQAEMAAAMGLESQVRIRSLRVINMSIKGDIFESFFGGLFTIGSKVSQGWGYAVSRKMIGYIMGGYTINPKQGEGHPKTQIIQTFTRFGVPVIEKNVNLIEKIDKMGSGVRFGIQLTPKMIQLIKSWEELSDIGVPILPWRELDSNAIIGTGTGATKEVAEYQAYSLALQNMEKHGLNLETIEQIKTFMEFSSPMFAPYAEALAVKKKKDNILRFKFFIPSKTTTNMGVIVQLRGLGADGKWRVLGSEYIPIDESRGDDTQTAQSAGRLAAVKSYLA